MTAKNNQGMHITPLLKEDADAMSEELRLRKANII